MEEELEQESEIDVILREKKMPPMHEVQSYLIKRQEKEKKVSIQSDAGAM